MRQPPVLSRCLEPGMQWSCLLVGVIFAVMSGSVLEAAVPAGWYLLGNNRKAYESGTEAHPSGEGTVAFLKSIEEDPKGFGTLMQSLSARKYRGQRLRLSADIRSHETAKGAALWMRVDGKIEGQTLAFDNMQNRLIKGTTDWQKIEIVLDIAEEAEAIAFGFLINGAGQVWVDGLQLESVDEKVRTTDLLSSKNLPEEPVNLEFKNR